MIFTIPTATITRMARGDKGIAVWSLQRALGITADGDFGPLTEEAVTNWQRARRLRDVDGIAGPATQASVARAVVDAKEGGLPTSLLDGFAQNEGGWLLAAINRQVAGGVDCGLFQRRVYSGDYGNQDVIQRAFNTAYQASLLKASLVERHNAFLSGGGTRDEYGGIGSNEKAWRLAALNHNYPAGASRLASTPIRSLTAYWTTPQTWVTAVGAKFPDGTPVRTPLEWCHRYAGVLGSVHGTRGLVTGSVTDWTP